MLITHTYFKILQFLPAEGRNTNRLGRSTYTSSRALFKAMEAATKSVSYNQKNGKKINRVLIV